MVKVKLKYQKSLQCVWLCVLVWQKQAPWPSYCQQDAANMPLFYGTLPHPAEQAQPQTR